MTSTPRHSEVIFGTGIPGTQITYVDFFHRYATSEFGLHHAEQPLRYSARYGYVREQMLEDFGDSVHPVRHMPDLEANTTIPFIAEQNTSGEEHFSASEIVAERIATLRHDQGECEHVEIIKQLGFSVGDIPWDLKTADDGQRERIIRQLIDGFIYPDIPKQLLEEADDIIDAKVGTFSREAFQVVERIDYYQTGLKAGEVVLGLREKGIDAAEQRYVQLGRLALDVIANHREELKEVSERFPYARKVLDTNARLYERILATLAA